MSHAKHTRIADGKLHHCDYHPRARHQTAIVVKPMAQEPLVQGETNRFVGIRFNETLFERMENAVEHSGSSRSALIRQAVERYLDEAREA